MDEQNYNLEQSIAELDKFVDLSAKETTNKDTCEALAEKAKIIYEQFPESEEIALRYAMALVNLSAKQENVEERWNTANSVKEIFDRFNQSETIALQYAMALFNLSNDHNDINDRKETISTLEDLSLEFQNSQDIALEYAKALFNLSNDQNDIKQRKETISTLEDLSLRFQNSQDIALSYAMALFNLSYDQNDINDRKETISKLKDLSLEFQDSQDIALQYAKALVNLSYDQNDINDCKETISKLEDLSLKFQNSQDIALPYAKALANLSIKQTELEEVAETAQKIKDIYIKFNEPQDIALSYATALVILSLKQTNLDKLNDTVSKLKKLAYNFEKNEDITLCYSEALAKIITKQQNKEEKLEIIDKLKRLHDRFVQSEEITVQYLTAQMDLVKNNQIKQSNLLEDIYQSLESIPSIKILNMLIEILENEEQFEQTQAQFPTTNIVKALDKLCFDPSIKEGKDEKEKDLLIRTLKRVNISNTKYDVLKTWIDDYGEDSKKINKLIKIYTLVQQIKYELGLKAEDKNRKLKFGHYTSGEALQSILGKEDKPPFSSLGKTRLNNANYMNDPEEGVILENILKLEKRNPLEPSSWFLMSFTSKTDDLAMWSQYGSNAEGVCIVLKENDFARYHSLSDLPWYQKISDKQIGYKMKSSVGIQNDNSLNESDKEKSTRGNESAQNYEDKHSTSKNDMDYLYRVAYVNDQFDIEETELFTSAEVTRLKKLLGELKSELPDYKNSKDPFYKAISNCIEEIRYLFKSVDYKYENELRILRYANLDSSNKEIKIDKTSGVGKLYVERENPIQIEKVIFGPKFPNPEYVTPLLKLLDNDIKYKKSTIKFR